MTVPATPLHPSPCTGPDAEPYLAAHAGGDVDRLTALVAADGLELPLAVDASVGPVLAALSDSAVLGRPLLAVARARARSRRRPGVQNRALRDGYCVLSRTSGVDPDSVLALVLRSAVLRLDGALDAALEPARAALRLLRASTPEGDTVDPLPGARAWLWTEIGTTMLLAGELRTAGTVFDIAAQIAEDDHQHGAALRASGLAALTRASSGEFRSIRDTAVVDDRTPPWDRSDAALPWTIARAMAALDVGDAVVARITVQDRFDAALGELWPFAARAVAGIHLEDGTATAGLAELAAVTEAYALDAPASPKGRAIMRLDRAMLLFAAGRVSEAATVLAGPDVSDTGRAESAVLARIDLANGAPERALARLRPSLADVDDRSVLLVATELLLAAAALWRLPDRDGALRHLRDAVHLLVRFGATLPLAIVPREDIAAMAAHLRPDEAVLLTGRLGSRRDVFGKIEDVPGMTRQELLILRELDRGDTIAEVAARLHLSRNTLKAHTRHVYRKLGVHSRQEALTAAHARGLL